MLAKQGTLAMWVAVGLTGYTGPWNPPLTRLRTSSWPTVPGEREAPMTATERGRSNLCIERAAALRSRSYSAANASGVGAMSITTRMTPDSKRRTLRVAGIPEDLHHGVVLQERVGRKALEPVPAALAGQVLEHQGPDAEALVGVIDHECNLSHVAVGYAVVLGDPDELAASFDHEHEVVRPTLAQKEPHFPV